MGQVALPGSNLSLQEAKEEARVIVVAEVVGFEFILGVGASWYMTGIELKPSASLKGECKAGDCKALTIGASGSEKAPRKGEEFLCFIIQYEGHPQILKLLPPTEENLAAVKAGD